MGNNGSVPQIRAKDVKRVCGKKYGWLYKAGLNNTQMQKRWCAVHDLKLFYYETPRDDEPKGVVNLKGAIVSHSKRIKMAIEIETGSLVSEKGVEKRTFFFTPAGAEHQATDEDSKRKQRRDEKKSLDCWFVWLQEESAKTFTPA